MQGIYKITNTITDEVYIGQAIEISRRFREHRYHLRKGDHSNKHLQASFNKYKELAFDFEIVEVVEDRSLLNDLEIYYIKLYNSFKYGYNQTAGGSIGEQKKDTSLYTFYHKDGRIEKNVMRSQFASKYNLSSAHISRLLKGDFYNLCGWRITEKEAVINPGKLYTFYHSDGRVEHNIQVSDMCKKYNLYSINLYKTIYGQRPHTKGWSGLERPTERCISRFSVVHTDGTIEENISVRFMAIKHNLCRVNLFKLYNGLLTEYKGWTILNINK